MTPEYFDRVPLDLPTVTWVTIYSMSVSDFWLSILANAVWSGIVWVFSMMIWPNIRQVWVARSRSVPVRVWLRILALQASGWFIFYAGFVVPPDVLAAFPGNQFLFLTFPAATTAVGLLFYGAERHLSIPSAVNG